MKAIKNFVDWSLKNNINLIATWPNTFWFEAYQEQQAKEFFQSINDFYQTIKVPLLGNYRYFMYDKSMFYDTSYHMNDKGVRYRTKQLIDLLQPILFKKSWYLRKISSKSKGSASVFDTVGAGFTNHIVSLGIGITTCRGFSRNYQLPITNKANHSDATGFDIIWYSLNCP